MLQALYEEYYLQFGQEEIVFGRGDINADVMFIGESPGEEEVRLNMAFVGTTRKMINHILNAIDMKREDVFMTYMIKHRLSKRSTTTGKPISRPAKATETMRTKPYLLREIVCVEPKYIVTFGNISLKAVVGGKGCDIASLHGQEQMIMLNDRTYPIFPLHNPSSAVYNQKIKGSYEQDISLLKENFKKVLT